MSRYWSLEPEVAGELGHASVLDTSVRPPVVSTLQYCFTGWLGDALLESFPCYIVTDALGAALLSSRLSGFALDAVDVVTSDEFDELYPSRALPGFCWLKVVGQPAVDDLGLSKEHVLVVSDAALQVLRQHGLSHCEIEELAHAS